MKDDNKSNNLGGDLYSEIEKLRGKSTIVNLDKLSLKKLIQLKSVFGSLIDIKKYLNWWGGIICMKY